MESPMASTNDSMQISESMDEQELADAASQDGEMQAAKCFSVIQTKKFWAPLLATTCRLCPSMDLIVLGMQTQSDPSHASSLWLHRTVSWQRLATLTNFETDNDTANNPTSSAMDSTTTSTNGVTHVAWSPDGRKFALALPTGDVVLYHAEAMVSSPHSSMAAGGDAHSQGRLCTVPVTTAKSQGIIGLTWAHVGRKHPSWNLTDAEEEEEISWSYRSRYLDRAKELLPPSEHYNQQHYHHHHHHHTQDHHSSGDGANNNSSASALPSCKTPLSLLCVSTKGNGLQVYLHGRYRILTLPMIVQRNVTVACSSDLSHLLVHQEKSMNLSLFCIPTISKYRYHLQIISSLYCCISSHMEAIQKHAPEILASWKVSIKPLDTKMETLVRLLRDYGVERDVRSVLVQYILVGHTSVSSDLSNAIDQFFTGVQMNDQLVTRMERSLQAAIANVETTARSFLLGPARALAFSAGELLGLARYHASSSLLSEQAAQRTHDCCAMLLTMVEYTLTQLVEARFRLRDFVAWLRSTGSEVKARGTAHNSAQRDNARKRRVPQATTERILKYLQDETHSSTSTTETCLGIPMTELLQDGTKFVHARASSPTTVVASNALSTRAMERKTPTVRYATKQTEKAVSEVFEHPREFMSGSVFRLDLFLPVERKTEFLPVAIHSRVGKGYCSKEDYLDYDQDETDDAGLLSPRILPGKSFPGSPSYDCRQWSIIAKTSSPTDSRENYSVKLYLIPHGWGNPSEDSEDDEDELGFGIEEDDIDGCARDCGVPFYLSTEIVLPLSYRVLDMGFYGDDGKSSLSSGLDSGTGRERRQALGLLLSFQEESIELWLLPYDNLTFQVIPTKKDSKQVFLDDGDIDSRCQVFAKARTSTDDDEQEEEEGFVYAKTRSVGSLDPSSSSLSSSSRILLSGSRGIGGVFTTLQGVTTLDLYDLEEDEDPESEGDSQSMDA